VDIGSNIGISALFFLTRNDHSRCHLYEPVPENVKRLRDNLAGFEDRYDLHEAAVADRAGRVEFGVEPTGRYGGIGINYERSIEVDCLEINRVLEDVLEREGEIDLLKLDIEGMELLTVRAIRPELLRRIGIVYFECEAEPGDIGGEGFERSYANSTCALRNRSPLRAA
jgi:FkbM family methyltransferase